jgi:hypothetical protein
MIKKAIDFNGNELKVDDRVIFNLNSEMYSGIISAIGDVKISIEYLCPIERGVRRIEWFPEQVVKNKRDVEFFLNEKINDILYENLELKQKINILEDKQIRYEIYNKCSVTSVETHPLINESKVDFVISYSIASSFFEMLLSNGSINFRISFVDALVEKIRKQLDEIMENTIKNYGAKNEI